MYILLLLVSLGVGLGTQFYIKHCYKKWAKVPISTGLTGAQAARRMLDANGLAHVAIQRVGGELTEHFDPRTNLVSLSADVYDGRSVASTAVACHECGHAIQHATAYGFGKFRDALVPVVNFASNAWIFVLMAGIFALSMFSSSMGFSLIWLAIALYAAVILFQLVTLPVEFNASRRAVAYVQAYGIPQQETGGARKVLTSAALTYVAAALSSLMYLLYLLTMTRNN
jgi:Zn-dependent membrane protease YugP